jgi:hypothetical protein
MEAMGGNVGALEMCNKGLAIFEKMIGQEYPDTLHSYCKAMGDNVSALEMYNKCLTSKIREKVLGEQHLRTIIPSNAVASNLQKYS